MESPLTCLRDFFDPNNDIKERVAELCAINAGIKHNPSTQGMNGQSLRSCDFELKVK